MRHSVATSFDWVTDPVKVINELRPEQNGFHFAVDILKRVFSKEKILYWFEFHYSLYLYFCLIAR